MTALVLDVRLDGFNEPVGMLVRNENAGLTFTYAQKYLLEPNAFSLSLSIPLTDEPYGDVITRAFFENLLQEQNEPLESLMAREGVARDDIAAQLFHLGKDCSGAISVLPAGAPPAKVPGDYSTDYERVSHEYMVDTVRSLHFHNLYPKEMRDPSPLAGVQNKFAFTILPDGSYAFPKAGSGAPTTHILKVPKRNHQADAKQEITSLKLSENVGIETIEAEFLVFGEIDTICVKRFDRAINMEGLVVRLHQEDFAQALGLPRELKYERYGKTGRRFDVAAIARVLNETSEPAISISNFINSTFFDLLIGNTDGHAKNHALLYASGRSPVLSPRYDLMPTRLDTTITDELSYRIGNATHINMIKLEDISEFLRTLGVATASGRKRISQNAVRKLTHDLADNLDDMQRNGLKLFADLIASNIRILCKIVGVTVPLAAQSRDAFISRGGGWLVS